MKKLSILFAILILIAACTKPSGAPPKTDFIKAFGTDVRRVIDREAGVVCYLSDVYYGESISCLPIGDTLLEDMPE